MHVPRLVHSGAMVKIQFLIYVMFALALAHVNVNSPTFCGIFGCVSYLIRHNISDPPRKTMKGKVHKSSRPGRLRYGAYEGACIQIVDTLNFAKLQNIRTELLISAIVYRYSVI